MEREDDLFEGQPDGDEDLFDLSLDDLSPDDLEQESEKEEPDEDIIELMELVEKGEENLDDDYGDASPIPEEDQPTQETDESAPEEIQEGESPVSESDLDLMDIPLDTDMDLFAEEEAQEEEELLDGSIGEVDLEEGMMDQEGETEEKAEEGYTEGAGLDDILGDETGDDQSVVSGLEHSQSVSPEEPYETAMEEEPLVEYSVGETAEETLEEQDIIKDEFEEKEAGLQAQGIQGISEEKIEEIVTRVVGDVVERVVRETMADVAEKVIRESIDSLKESLEEHTE